MNNIEEIRASLAGRLGEPYASNPNLITFTTIVKGSVITGGQIGVDPSLSGNTVLSTANSITPSGGWGTFKLASASYSANGFTPSS